MQLVSNTKVNPPNHCLFSLSATKVTTLPLKQPTSFTVLQLWWYLPHCLTASWMWAIY